MERYNHVLATYNGNNSEMTHTNKSKVMSFEQQNNDRQCNLIFSRVRAAQKDVASSKNDTNIQQREVFAQDAIMYYDIDNNSNNNNRQHCHRTNIEYDISTMPSPVWSEPTPIKVKTTNKINFYDNNSCDKENMSESNTPNQRIRIKPEKENKNVSLPLSESFNALSNGLASSKRESLPPSLMSVNSTLSSHVSDNEQNGKASFTAHTSSRYVLDSSCDNSANMKISNNSKRSCSNVSEGSRNSSDVALSESYMSNFDSASSNQSDISINTNTSNGYSSSFSRPLPGRKHESKRINGKNHFPFKNNKNTKSTKMKNANEFNGCVNRQQRRQQQHSNDINNVHDTTTKTPFSRRQEFNSPLFGEEYNQPINANSNFINDFSFGENEYSSLMWDDSQEQIISSFQSHTKEEQDSDVVCKDNIDKSTNDTITTTLSTTTSNFTTVKSNSAHDYVKNTFTRHMERTGRNNDSRKMSLIPILQLSENNVNKGKDENYQSKYSQTEEGQQTQQLSNNVTSPPPLLEMGILNVYSNRNVNLVIPHTKKETEPNLPIHQHQQSEAEEEQETESERIQRLPSHYQLETYSPYKMHKLSDLTVENLHKYKQQEQMSKWQHEIMHELKNKSSSVNNNNNKGFVLTASNSHSFSRLSQASSGNRSRSRSNTTCRSSSRMSNSSIDSCSVARLKRKAQWATEQFVQSDLKEQEHECNTQSPKARTNREIMKVQTLSAVEVSSETPTRMTSAKNNVNVAQEPEQKTRSNSKSLIKRILHRCFSNSDEKKTSESEKTMESSIDKSNTRNSFRGNECVSTSLMEYTKRVQREMFVPENQQIASAPLATHLNKRSMRSNKWNVYENSNSSNKMRVGNCKNTFFNRESQESLDDEDCVVLETSACRPESDEFTPRLLKANLNTPSREVPQLHASGSSNSSSNNSNTLKRRSHKTFSLPLIRKANLRHTSKCDQGEEGSSKNKNRSILFLQEVAKYDEMMQLPNYAALKMKNYSTTNAKNELNGDVLRQTEEKEMKVKSQESSVQTISYSGSDVVMSKEQRILPTEKNENNNRSISQSHQKTRQEHKGSHRCHNLHDTNSGSHYNSNVNTESIINSSNNKRRHLTPHKKQSSCDNNKDSADFYSYANEEDVNDKGRNLSFNSPCKEDKTAMKERNVCDLRELIALSSFASSKEREDIIHERLSTSSGHSCNSQSWRRRRRDRRKSSTEPFRPFKISAEKFKQVQAEKLKEMSQIIE